MSRAVRRNGSVGIVHGAVECQDAAARDLHQPVVVDRSGYLRRAAVHRQRAVVDEEAGFLGTRRAVADREERAAADRVKPAFFIGDAARLAFADEAVADRGVLAVRYCDRSKILEPAGRDDVERAAGSIGVYLAAIGELIWLNREGVRRLRVNGGVADDHVMG